MIAYLKGQIKFKSNPAKKDSWLVLDVGGVGYKVFVLDKLISQVKQDDELELYVYTQVAETALDLYGFQIQEELNFFEILLSINGVGPKSALGILQKAKIEDLKQAASTGNPDILNKVSGIGSKTAEKIVAGIKNKIGGLEPGVENWDNNFGDALDALIGLGYNPAQAREALSKCQSLDPGEKVREALKILGGKARCRKCGSVDFRPVRKK